jgi:metallo-beta-lactamase class B
MPQYFLALALVSFSLAAQTASSITNPQWTQTFPPFRIVGNLYYVGTYDLACYLVVTPQGNILINTGLASSAAQIQSSLEQLGVKLSSIKILTATHAHFDHVAAMAEMQRRTGGAVWSTEKDASLLESGGKTDFRWGQDPGAHFAPVHVDRKFKDGEKIALGGTELTVHLHPGHTPGAASFSLVVHDGARDYRVLIANMGSINPGVLLRHNPKYPAIADDYARTFRLQKDLTPDIWLSSHASQFDLHTKYKPGDPYNPGRFVDPSGYRAAVERLEKIYNDQMASEK